MANPKCPICDSPYTDYVSTEKKQEETKKIYYCNNCKKNFDVSEKREVASGEFIFKFQEDGRGDIYAEGLRNSSGGLNINQKKKGEFATITHTPKLYVKAYLQNKWEIVLDTFKSANDKNGNYITLNRIMLNEELTKKAFENQAMRAAWDDKRQCFYLDGNHNYQMLTDIVKWLQPVVGIPEGTSSVSGGCYVATAVYGSYDCPQVWTLRRYRDFYLAERWYGRLFIKCYYAISPLIVKLFGETRWFKKLWKSKLDPWVDELNFKGYESTPYNDREWD